MSLGKLIFDYSAILVSPYSKIFVCLGIFWGIPVAARVCSSLVRERVDVVVEFQGKAMPKGFWRGVCGEASADFFFAAE